MADRHLERTEVRIDRIVAASPEQVWETLTTPDAMARWMWASPDSDGWAEADLRVGGAYRVYAPFAGGIHQGEGWSGMCGLYVEIVPHRHLVFTMHWDADVGYNAPGTLTLDEVVSITLVPDDGMTKLTWVRSGVPDDGTSVDGHTEGDTASLDTLAVLVEG